MAQAKARIWQAFKDQGVVFNKKGGWGKTFISAKALNDCLEFTTQRFTITSMTQSSSQAIN